MSNRLPVLHVKIIITWIVEKIGFMPFVYRVAVEKWLVCFIRDCNDAIIETVMFAHLNGG